MPKVANDGSPLHERLVYGKYGTIYLPLLVDASGNLVVALNAGGVVEVEQADAADLKATVDVAAGQTITVTQATAANLKALVDINTDQNVQARAYGYHSAAWVKSPVVFGPTAAAGASVANAALAAGTNDLLFISVAANTVLVVTSMNMWYAGTVPTSLTMFIRLAGVSQVVYAQLAPASGVFYDRQGWWVLAAGDNLMVRVAGATLNDDLVATYTGFTMSVA